jgi:membrane protein
MRLFRLLKEIVVAVFRHFDESDGWAMGSHVALSWLISIFPFLIFATSMATYVDDEHSRSEITKLIFDSWPHYIAKNIVDEIKIVLDNYNIGFLTTGFIFSLFFASNGISAIRTALNRAYRDSETRSTIAIYSQNIFFVVLIALSLLAFTQLLAEIPQFQTVSNTSLPSPTKLSSFVAIAILLCAFHVFLPASRRPLLRILPGVCMTLLFWFMTARLFAYYVFAIADYSAIYAGLAGVMTVLILLYLLGVILILGAELNAELERRFS